MSREVLDDGSREVWGTGRSWDPPHGLACTWHPGREPDTALDVLVVFEERNSGSLVRVTQTGWDRLGDLAGATRQQYEAGWPAVLDAYRQD